MAVPAYRGGVLSKDGLNNIVNHQYKPGVYTPLDNVLNPFWLWAVELLPQWFAPNLVTFTGFIPMMVAYVLMWLYSPTYETSVPRWVSFLTAFSVFFYQTMDAMDGKQARRTGASSPLGQLFDHGCDCLAMLTMHSIAGIFMCYGSGTVSLLGYALMQGGYFMAQWEEHYTGILQTACGPIGVTELQYTLIALAVFVGAVGPEATEAIAHKPVSTPWSSTPEPAGIICVLGWGVFSGTLIVISMFKSLKTASTQGRFFEALRDLVPVVVLSSLLLTWHPVVASSIPHFLTLSTGLLYFFFSCQMILFSMAKMDFPLSQPWLVPYGLLSISSRLFPSLAAIWINGLRLLTIVIMVVVLRWLLTVITELKGALNVWVFVIGRPPKKD